MKEFLSQKASFALGGLITGVNHPYLPNTRLKTRRLLSLATDPEFSYNTFFYFFVFVYLFVCLFVVIS